MSVIVKGMKFPENCLKCDLRRYGANGEEYCPFTQIVCLNIQRRNNCPLVGIPDGRLINADELIEDLKHDITIDQDYLDYGELAEINRKLTQEDKDIKQNVIDLLEHTRCIIEAEGAES